MLAANTPLILAESEGHRRICAWRRTILGLGCGLAKAPCSGRLATVQQPLMMLRRVPILVVSIVSIATLEIGLPSMASAYVALMAGQRARGLNGTFNNVPVLHSNQPEIVTGPGILVNTARGSAIAAETNRPLRNPAYTFNGEFGVHMHHKYYPDDKRKMGGRRDRGLLTLALIASNPGRQPVTLRFDKGSVKNSFEAPYLPNNLMGVKPLGKRPWNTGPGDATAVQMLRKELDRKLKPSITIPPGGKAVVVSTVLPARGIANGLLHGRSDGPFTMAVVAAEETNDPGRLISVLNSGRLAPGRIYLNRIRDIQLGRVFSRVAGVALGDTYNANIQHDLRQGPLHVPLTSTSRHNFGTRDVQVNPLSTRMADSALNNVGTYGVRYDVTLNLSGSGAHQLVMSHPVVSGKKQFTAFRGSIRIETVEGYREVHVGLRSGESLALADLNLIPGQANPVKLSLVYPADATPGHLLSVVPVQQLAMLRRRENQLEQARIRLDSKKGRTVSPNAPPPVTQARPVNPPALPKIVPSMQMAPLTSPKPSPVTSPRYQEAIQTQQEWLREMQRR